MAASKNPPTKGWKRTWLIIIFYKLIRGEEHAQSHQKEFVLVGRLSVLAVAIVALAIAWSRNLL
jgi:Na+/proline symporter